MIADEDAGTVERAKRLTLARSSTSADTFRRSLPMPNLDGATPFWQTVQRFFNDEDKARVHASAA
jgi:hypothetical protein